VIATVFDRVGHDSLLSPLEKHGISVHGPS
jgi:hypothetical protein